MLKESYIAEVQDAIDAIGTVSLGADQKISKAHGTYSVLTPEEKKQVSNFDVLNEAIERLGKLQIDAKEKAPKAAVAKLKAKTDKVEGITWYEPSAYPSYTNSRSYVLPCIGKSSSSSCNLPLPSMTTSGLRGLSKRA